MRSRVPVAFMFDLVGVLAVSSSEEATRRGRLSALINTLAELAEDGSVLENRTFPGCYTPHACYQYTDATVTTVPLNLSREEREDWVRWLRARRDEAYQARITATTSTDRANAIDRYDEADRSQFWMFRDADKLDEYGEPELLFFPECG